MGTQESVQVAALDIALSRLKEAGDALANYQRAATGAGHRKGRKRAGQWRWDLAGMAVEVRDLYDATFSQHMDTYRPPSETHPAESEG